MPAMAEAASLELGLTGNGAISALVDAEGRYVWACLPRFDGDPVFHALLGGALQQDSRGLWAVELEGVQRREQHYLANTAVLVTELHASDGSAIRITDFCPRFAQHGRMYRPQMHVRRLTPLAGTPRIRMKLRPSWNYGAARPALTHGSNHLRYVGPAHALRLTTDAPLSYVADETPFLLEQPLSFLLGPDETLPGAVEATARELEEQTVRHWREWVQRLALPLEWQDAVIRAAITLKLCMYEETGAIVAAMTTSVPEAPPGKDEVARNWDYRYCWLRDAHFVVRALNALSDVETLEHYLRFIGNVARGSADGALQPVYGLALERDAPEREPLSLPGYRGFGPVRVGNQAFRHAQHDVYGNVVLAATQAFFDRRLLRPATPEDFHRLERLGEQALKVHATPDAGMWEFRSRARVHTSSALMSWAACNRLMRIATHLRLPERAAHWRASADTIGETISRQAWSPARNSYVESFGGADLEAGLLLMADVGFADAADPRFAATLAAIEASLRRGNHLLRYHAADDFGTPRTAFTVCTFWYIDALTRLGRTQEARTLFENLLASRTKLGLLSEDIDPQTGELWGNFPQTYSMVGIINGAMRLSRGWESVV